ncbi:MAG TPA: CoA pyrophosphatase [Gemmatimonadales bacterium]|jgi:8-oxo-dGTP pyrophosphatase MutT (NUDIX family)
MPLERLIERLRASTPRHADDLDRPRAAVALALAPNPDQILLIRRAERVGDPWSGHLALPGGRRQDDDPDLLATAIRETFEETGIQLQREWCVAQLDDLVPRTPTLPPIVVRPFVFVIDRAHEPGTSGEVVQSMWTSIEALARAGVVTRRIDVKGSLRDVAGYAIGDGLLWGMTERIVTPVLALWEEARLGTRKT